MRDATNESDRRRLDRRIENEYLPLYIQAAESVLLELELEAVQQMAREIGIPASELDISLSDKVKFRATTIAKEMFNRAHGNFREQMSGEVDTPDGDRRAIKLLAATTVLAIAAKAVSTAYNDGREQVIDVVVEVTGADPMATRNAVMDSNTCGPCRDRDGVSYKYGSNAYQINKPPNHCEGRGRCRCVYTYSIPINVLSGM